MEYDIITLFGFDSEQKDGIITWEPENNRWGFNTNNPILADALREIGNQGYIHKYGSKIKNSSIFEIIEKIYPKDTSFIKVLQDALVDQQVLELRLKK